MPNAQMLLVKAAKASPYAKFYNLSTGYEYRFSLQLRCLPTGFENLRFKIWLSSSSSFFIARFSVRVAGTVAQD